MICINCIGDKNIKIVSSKIHKLAVIILIFSDRFDLKMVDMIMIWFPTNTTFISTNIFSGITIYIIVGFCYLPLNSSYCWKTPHRNSCMLSGPSGNTNANSPWASHVNDANCYFILIWNQHVFKRLVAKYLYQFKMNLTWPHLYCPTLVLIYIPCIEVGLQIL